MRVCEDTGVYRILYQLSGESDEDMCVSHKRKRKRVIIYSDSEEEVYVGESPGYLLVAIGYVGALSLSLGVDKQECPQEESPDARLGNGKHF